MRAWLRANHVGLLGMLLVLSLTALVYRPGLDGGFVFDDLPNIVDNTELHVTTLRLEDWSTAAFSSPASRLQRPLAMLTFAANHYFTGLDPRPMKLTNLAIHLLNALLAFGLMRCLLGLAASQDLPGLQALRDGERGRFVSLFTVAAWALHPINLMAVLFIVQRMESLCHTFVFAGLWCYLAARRRQLAGEPGWGGVLLGLGVFTVLGVLVKESAALLPLYAACVEVCLLRFRAASPSNARALRWLYVLGLVLPALAALFLFGGEAVQPGAFSSRNYDLWQRLLTESRVVLDYLRWHLLPDLGRMSLYHDDYLVSRGLLSPPSTLFAIVVLAAVFAAALWLRTRRPLCALGLMWFFAAQALTATVIPLELMFEHRNYFASLGICLALGDLLLLAPTPGKRTRAGALLALLLLCFFASTTWLRASEWDHPVRFASTEVAKHPQSPRATYELARLLVIMSRFQPDSPHLPRAMAALERAREVPGSTVQASQALLIVASRTGQPLQDAWWDDIEHKLRTQPVTPQVTGAMAALMRCEDAKLCSFPRERMLRMFAAALSHGDDPEVLNIYGSYALNGLMDPRLSLALWQQAVELRPSEPQYHINLARLLIAMHSDVHAREQIAQLRALGRFGQYESLAQKLEQELQASSHGKR